MGQRGLQANGRAKWNGFVLWSVRARARTAVHRAVGSPLGPPGVLTPARRRASSVLRSPVCVRSRGLRRCALRSGVLRRCALRSGVLRSSPLRSAAPRGAVRCTPASRTPPRRTPARPLSCRPLPPSRNPRPTALRPSGLQPCALSVPPQTPRPLSGRVFCGPPCKVRMAAKPPTATCGLRRQKALLGIEPATFRSSTLNLDHSDRERTSFPQSCIPASRCSVRSAGRRGALGRTCALA